MKSSKSEQSHHSIGLGIVYLSLRIDFHGKRSCCVTESFCNLTVNLNVHTYTKFYFFPLGKMKTSNFISA